MRSFSQAIEGARVSSPTAGVVDIRITLTGGELPQQAFIDRLADYLEDKRPMTDRLQISAPDPVYYAVDCTFYIAREDSKRQGEIQEAVATAVKQYISWQGEEIGRNLSPNRLTKMAVEAGASRILIPTPEYAVVPQTGICRLTEQRVTYGGIEDDGSGK